MFEVQIIIVSRGDLGTYEGRVFVHKRVVRNNKNSHRWDVYYYCYYYYCTLLQIRISFDRL